MAVRCALIPAFLFHSTDRRSGAACCVSPHDRAAVVQIRRHRRNLIVSRLGIDSSGFVLVVPFMVLMLNSANGGMGARRAAPPALPGHWDDARPHARR